MLSLLICHQIRVLSLCEICALRSTLINQSDCSLKYINSASLDRDNNSWSSKSIQFSFELLSSYFTSFSLVIIHSPFLPFVWFHCIAWTCDYSSLASRIKSSPLHRNPNQIFCSFNQYVRRACHTQRVSNSHFVLSLSHWFCFHAISNRSFIYRPYSYTKQTVAVKKCKWINRFMDRSNSKSHLSLWTFETKTPAIWERGRRRRRKNG